MGRVARLAFLTPNLKNLAFLEAVGVKKIVWLFGFFFSIFGFFWRELEHTIRLVFWLFKYLPEKLLGFFRQCLVYFLNSYLATYKRIKL